MNANQKATKNISGCFSTVSVFACKRIFIKKKTAGWSFVAYRLSDEPELTEITNTILFSFFFFGPVVWLDECSEALEVLKLVWIILLKMTVWHFFLYYRDRESSERRLTWNTSSRLKQKFSDWKLNLLRTANIQEAVKVEATCHPRFTRFFFVDQLMAVGLCQPVNLQFEGINTRLQRFTQRSEIWMMSEL